MSLGSPAWAGITLDAHPARYSPVLPAARDRFLDASQLGLSARVALDANGVALGHHRFALDWEARIPLRNCDSSFLKTET